MYPVMTGSMDRMYVPILLLSSEDWILTVTSPLGEVEAKRIERLGVIVSYT